MIKSKIDEFKEIRDKFGTRIEELEKEIFDINNRLGELGEQRIKALEYEAINFKVAPEREAIEKEVEQLRGKLTKLEEVLSLTKRARMQRFAEMVPGIKAYRDKVKQDVQAEHDQTARELRRIKAEYLLVLKRLSEIKAKGSKVNADYLYLKRVANPEDTRHEYFSIQELSLIMEENGWVRPEKSYMLFKEEVYKAYREGILPAWVEEYEKTGKLPE